MLVTEGFEVESTVAALGGMDVSDRAEMGFAGDVDLCSELDRGGRTTVTVLCSWLLPVGIVLVQVYDQKTWFRVGSAQLDKSDRFDDKAVSLHGRAQTHDQDCALVTASDI